MRDLAERLVADGHEVTYLTRTAVGRGRRAGDPGRARGGRLAARGALRARRQPDRRGAAALRLGRVGAPARATGVPTTPCTPARSRTSRCWRRASALLGTGVRIGVDWFEVWGRRYWSRYLGGPRGWVGWFVQRLCVLATPQAFVFSRLHGERLREEGLRRAPVRLGGLYAGPVEPRDGARRRRPGAPLVVFAGRHIAEKRAPSVPAAVLAARSRVPGVRGLVLGDGPERPLVLEAIAALGAGDVVEAPGFVGAEEVRDAFARAACLLLPSSREGYGLVVIEAAAAGTPSVVVAGEDNAAVELVEEGVNGFVAASEDPQAVAEAIARCVEGGAELRASTAAWFAAAGARAVGRRVGRARAGGVPPVILGVDARAAAEVPAGRGRYVRELLTALAALPDDGTRYRLYGREPLGRAGRALRVGAARAPGPRLARRGGGRRLALLRGVPVDQLLPDRVADPDPDGGRRLRPRAVRRPRQRAGPCRPDRARHDRPRRAPRGRLPVHLRGDPARPRRALPRRRRARVGRAAGRRRALRRAGRAGLDRRPLRARRRHARAAQEPRAADRGLGRAARARCAATTCWRWSGRRAGTSTPRWPPPARTPAACGCSATSPTTSSRRCMPARPRSPIPRPTRASACRCSRRWRRGRRWSRRRCPRCRRWPGDAALLVDPYDVRALREALALVLRDPARRAELRERGRMRSAAFTWERTARTTRDLLRSLTR